MSMPKLLNVMITTMITSKIFVALPAKRDRVTSSSLRAYMFVIRRPTKPANLSPMKRMTSAPMICSP
jgi:hypothetical protein